MVGSLQNRELEIMSLPENINKVEVLIEELKEEFGLTEEMEANILVSLSEAVNNAIFHGNQSNPSKKVKIGLQKSDTELKFFVEDEGPGFDFNDVKDPTAPENLDKPAGRGIFLIKSLADHVEFLNNGSKVVMSFYQN